MCSMQVVAVMEAWGFVYVENLAWIKVSANNRVIGQTSQYFAKSKASLVIFRRNTEEWLELCHQRNSDVCFDFFRPYRKRTMRREAKRCCGIVVLLVLTSLVDWYRMRHR